ncbi:MAG: GxxExxY protein [Pirellulales bacterium]
MIQDCNAAAADAEAVAAAIVDSAIKVHRALGPGLLESVYEACLCYELSKRGISVRRQVTMPVRYEDVYVETGYRIDIVAGESVIIEVKAVDAIIPIHEAQLLTYLKLTNLHVGFILNFNTTLMKQGIKRMVR